MPDKAQGIDISQWQHLFDLGPAKESGIEFAFIRASVRDKRDPFFYTHKNSAVRAGMLVGAYHFLYPYPDPYAQGEMFGNIMVKLDEEEVQLPAVLDVEQDSNALKRGDPPLAAGHVGLFLRGFWAKCDEPIMFYTSKHYWRQIVGEFDEFWQMWNRLGFFNDEVQRTIHHYYPNDLCPPLWVADHRVVARIKNQPLIPKPWDKYGYDFWQFGKRRIPGYKSAVDRNEYNGTIEEFLAEFGSLSPS